MPWLATATNLRNELQLLKGPPQSLPSGWALQAQNFEVYAALSNLHQLLNEALDSGGMPPMQWPPPLQPPSRPIGTGRPVGAHPTSTYLGGTIVVPPHVETLAWTLAAEIEAHRVANNLSGANWLSYDQNLSANDHTLIQEVQAFLRDAEDCD